MIARIPLIAVIAELRRVNRPGKCLSMAEIISSVDSPPESLQQLSGIPTFLLKGEHSMLNKTKAAIVGGLLIPVSQAFAAVPADVTSALGDMKTDALVVGTAFVVAVIALKALKLMKRA